MQQLPNAQTMRKRLPNRRASGSIEFEHEGLRYHCTASRFPDSALAEIFLSCSKVGSAAQMHADCSAIMASLLLQHGLDARVLARCVAGSAIAAAIELVEAPA